MKQAYNLLDDILNDTEKNALRAFYDNELMRETVRKVLLAGVYHNGTLQKGKKCDPLTNFALTFAANRAQLGVSHEEIGKDLVAKWEGINSLMNAFDYIAIYQSDDKIERSKTKENPAR